jgi:hypothetical protein
MINAVGVLKAVLENRKRRSTQHPCVESTSFKDQELSSDFPLIGKIFKKFFLKDTYPCEDKNRK